MRSKLLILSSLIGGALLVLVWLPPEGTTCRFIALDVGQGDALLIQTPDGNDVLIDGGPSSQVIEQLPKYLGAGNQDLELVILSHPDADHLRGLVAVVERFEIETILVSDVETKTSLFEAWQAVLKKHALVPRVVSQGQRFELGAFLEFTILWPPPGDGWQVGGAGTSTNEASVSLQLTCAGSTAILTGDASMVVEERIGRSGIPMESNLLKVGHHGSRSSSDHDFLRQISPAIAVISVGADNRYGHPHPAVLRRLENLNIKVFRTDKSGTLVFDSDGKGSWQQDLTKQ